MWRARCGCACVARARRRRGADGGHPRDRWIDCEGFELFSFYGGIVFRGVPTRWRARAGCCAACALARAALAALRGGVDSKQSNAPGGRISGAGRRGSAAAGARIRIADAHAVSGEDRRPAVSAGPGSGVCRAHIVSGRRAWSVGVTRTSCKKCASVSSSSDDRPRTDNGVMMKQTALL